MQGEGGGNSKGGEKAGRQAGSHAVRLGSHTGRCNGSDHGNEKKDGVNSGGEAIEFLCLIFHRSAHHGESWQQE